MFQQKYMRPVILGLIGAVSCIQVSWAQLAKPSVRITAEPATGQLLPFEADAKTPQLPAKLTIKALDATGKPLNNAIIRLRMSAPPENLWYPTDFPAIEGTELLDLAAIAPEGQLQFAQMFPIRGNYQLHVEIDPVDGKSFTPMRQIFQLSVPENVVKYLNFLILAAILLALGFGGGWIIGSRQPLEPGEIAPQRVRLLLSGATLVAIAALLFVNISAELADSHEHTHAHDPADQIPSVLKSGNVEVRLLGDTEATVGEPAYFSVQAIDTNTKKPATNLRLRVTTTALEGNWVAFAHENVPDATGKMSWQQQFFDGAPHQVKVEVLPQPGSPLRFEPFAVGQTVEVDGVAPPLISRFIVLGYLTGIIVIGLLVGLHWQENYG